MSPQVPPKAALITLRAAEITDSVKLSRPWFHPYNEERFSSRSRLHRQPVLFQKRFAFIGALGAGSGTSGHMDDQAAFPSWSSNGVDQ